MGKIRVKTFGDEEQEKEQEKKAKQKKEAKKAAKKSVEETPGISKADSSAVIASEEKQSQPSSKPTKKEKFAKTKKITRSKKYKTVLTKVDRNKTYPLSEALSLLPQLQISTFDETVELHINTLETGVAGSITLPHGTGKKTRVAIANEEVIKQIESGNIAFDILLAEPSMMARLAKVARVLGPRGLMPNPKNGTITAKPEEAAKKYEGGQINFKTEGKAPIIHVSVGKVSFGDKKLAENIGTFIKAIPSSKIRNITLKSTMSPGIKINFAEL